MLFPRRTWFLIVTLSLTIGSGCSDAAKEATSPLSSSHSHNHDGHDHGPRTLKDAVAELTALRDTIRDSFARNDHDAAHDPLHDVGELLDSIPKLSAQEKVDAEQQAVIETQVNTLMDAFGRVDKTMHGQEGSTYAEESATIDNALSALGVACTSGKPSTENLIVPAEGQPTAAEKERSSTISNEVAGENGNG